MNTPQNNDKNNGHLSPLHWRRQGFAFRVPEEVRARVWDSLESAANGGALNGTPSFIETEMEAQFAGVRRQLQGLADRAEARRKMHEEEEIALGVAKLKETIVSRRLRFVGGWLDWLDFLVCSVFALVVVGFAWGNVGYFVNDAVQPFFRALLVAWPCLVVGLLFHEGAARAGFTEAVAARCAWALFAFGTALFFSALIFNFGSPQTADDIASSGVIQPDLRLQYFGQTILELGAVWILTIRIGGKFEIVEETVPNPKLKKAQRQREKLRDKQDKWATARDQYLGEIDRLEQAKQPYMMWEQDARAVISREAGEYRQKMQRLRATFVKNNTPTL